MQAARRCRSVAGQRLQQGHAQRPFAVAGFDVDVAGVLQAHKLAAPGPRIGAGQAHRAIRVVAAGHQHAAVGQLLVRHGCEVAQDGAALRVGRRHQQGALDARARPRAADAWWRCNPGCARRSPPARAAPRWSAPSDRHPGLARGRDPVVLLHPHGIGQALGPQALPVAGAGVAPAGNDDDGDHDVVLEVAMRWGRGGLCDVFVKTQTTCFLFGYADIDISIPDGHTTTCRIAAPP